MARLDGRVGIVTGAAQGIGREYALGLAAEGARIVVADIDDPEPVAAEITDAGGEAIGVVVDVSDETSTQAMADRTIERFGQIDVLVNNAALYGALELKFWRDIEVAEWDRVMAVNLRGVFLCCRAVTGPMMERGSGKIINISSGTALTGVPGLLHYVTSKGGVIGLTRALAREMGALGITVNAVTPGFTMSDGSKQLLLAAGAPIEDPTTVARCLPRAQQPSDLVGTVVFLASSDADYITAQVINVDGGWIAY